HTAQSTRTTTRQNQDEMWSFRALRLSRGHMGFICAKQHTKLDWLLLALLLLCYGVGNTCCSTVHENSGDLHALIDFKQGITSDPNGALSSWNTSIHYCRWKGVICTLKRPWRVSNLSITGQSIAGEITPSLANLTLLSTLDLSSNLLVGEIPPLNGQQLKTIYLNNNSLEGNIPDTLTNCTNLRNLDLSTNDLSGVIPVKIDSLSNLEFFYIFSNNLTGSIPSTFSNLTLLSYAQLTTNQLEGNIPEGLWQLPNMVDLQLGMNRLTGEIPQSINMSSLQILSVEFNKLGKALPSNIGIALPSLQKISLAGNSFECQIPASLGNASGLIFIDLSANSFTGQVPTDWGKHFGLTILNFEKNMLEGGDIQIWEFFHALRNCTSLKKLALAQNRLSGVIPNSIGNLSTTLEQLSLSFNSLSGSVPPMGNLHSLIRLVLSENNLGGSIGEWIGKLQKLDGLSLLGNKFTGPIPSSIGNLTRLSLLFLDRNEFEGSMPSSIGNLSQLSILKLSYNNLQGNIPTGISNLKQLRQLHLSSNKLTGEIPDSLGLCQNLEIIQMDKNFLVGDIPTSLGDIKSLHLLNFSHNKLSGSIPIALTNLPVLDELDLSYNSLKGEIPRYGIFANATAVSLYGNQELCGGVDNLHMRPCPTISHRSKRQYYLIRVLIPIFGFMSLALLVYFLFLVKKAQRRNESLTSFGKSFLKVSYNDLAQATMNFSDVNLVGRGSYGSVYRGKLKEQKVEVAVKVFNLEMQDAERSFLLECEALRSIQHRNLLPIITACSTVDSNGHVFKALVYEFMPNGNLDTWLHHKGEGEAKKRLGLIQRISIALDIANALDYLHFDCGRPTVHCDLKPSNILLDDDMTALLGDFGIARFYADSSTASTVSISSIGVKGTIGYIAPEYAGGGHASISGDAYSFGIVLLEMLVGKRPTDALFKDGLDIVSFVESNFPHQILKVLDPYLIDELKDFARGNMAPENTVNQCVASLLQVALSCTRSLPTDRMNTKQIATQMRAIKTSYLGRKAK
ncbi:hypothetical protein ABZP36_032413, partial [Zizania latifolia]